MARPERNNVDYFPFICEDGNKMFYIEETYGNDGFAVFVKILRELAKTNYHYLDLSKPTTVMFLSAKCKVTKEVLISIVSDLTELGKFDTVLWSENKIIWCADFIESIQDAYKKRSNECITYEGLLSLLISLGIRKRSKSTSEVPVKPQRKVKDNKENEILLEIRKNEFYESLKPFVENYSKQLIREFFDYWSEANKTKTKMKWELQKTFEIPLRLKTWARNDKNFIPVQKEETTTFNRNSLNL